jgi:hypothetical protein
MQRDGIVKSLEQLIPQAQPAFNAHPADAQGLNNGTKSGEDGECGDGWGW